MTPYYKTQVPGQTTPPDQWSDTPSSSSSSNKGSKNSSKSSSSSSSSWATYNKQAIKPEISQKRYTAPTIAQVVRRKHTSLDPGTLGIAVHELQRQSLKDVLGKRKSVHVTRTTDQKNSFLDDIEDESAKKETFKKQLSEQRKNLISHSPRRQQLYYIYHLILNQTRFTYTNC